MSKLPPLVVLALLLMPFAIMVLLVMRAPWAKWDRSRGLDSAHRLLLAAVSTMGEARREWGLAMLAEMHQVRGWAARWRFALGCTFAAVFPPRRDGWPRFLGLPRLRLVSPCGVYGVVLPPLGLPMLFVVSLACNAFMTHDDFSSGELVPTLLGAAIWLCIACVLAGIPLGIAGALRRERARHLAILAPVSSILVFGYLQIVQFVAQESL